jgi:DNA-binding NarL/FixJ family response regulator
MEPITVAIAAQDGTGMAQCRNTLRHDGEIIVLRQSVNSENLVTRMCRLKPRILLLSADLCTDAECSLLQALRRKCPGTLVMLVGPHAIEDDQLANALLVGARGYLEQGDLERLLARAVHGVDRGEAWVTRKMLGKIMEMSLS